MKCPVCNLESSTLLCSNCGFDASRDYEHYPTFGPVGQAMTASRLRTQRANNSPKSDGPQYVNYREMVSRAAKEDARKRESSEHKLLTELQAAKIQISALKRDHKNLTDSLLPENQHLKERILAVSNENKDFQKRCRELENLIRQMREVHSTLTLENTELQKQLNAFQQDVNKLKQERNRAKENLGQLRHRNDQLGEQNRNLKRANSELQTNLATANSKIAELEAALEAERNKGLLSRILNR